MKPQTAEKLFAREAKAAGFKVRRSPAIKIDEPVADKRGKVRKRCTVPDWLIKDRRTGREFFIEITNGAGNNPHKEAQQRVIDAAGIENYRVITGHRLEMLRQALTAEQKYLLLMSFLQE